MVRTAQTPHVTLDVLVNKAPHYNQGDIECIDAIETALGRDGFIAWLRGTIIKYQWRLLEKEVPVADAKKAQYYQARLIATLEKDG
jgi:Protein of unknwon function (DUF3310)